MSRFRFCFTVDTEPDDLGAGSPTISFENLGRLLELHKALASVGARPTYLTTSEVVENVAAAWTMGRILETGRAEVGAHFHTWTRAWPFDIPDLGTPPARACVHRLGQPIEERMLDFTCRAIESALHIRPVSYRGGRWSLNGDSVVSLRNCGIRVDSTISPGINWEDPSHLLVSGPDFRAFDSRPFYLACGSLEPYLQGDVLEVPVGAAFLPDRRAALHEGLAARIKRRFWRTLGRPFGFVWLRPTYVSRKEMRKCLEQLRDQDVPVWVAMIHSSETIRNHLFHTEAEVRAFRQRCLEVTEDAIELGAVGRTLEETWNEFQQGGLDCRKSSTGTVRSESQQGREVV